MDIFYLENLIKHLGFVDHSMVNKIQYKLKKICMCDSKEILEWVWGIIRME
jgi:hypothetical protein